MPFTDSALTDSALTDAAAPWAGVSARDAARALLELGGATDDALVLADVLTPAVMAAYRPRAPKPEALVAAGKAATARVANKAVKIIRARLRVRREGLAVFEDWANRAPNTEPHPTPTWLEDEPSTRLHALRESAVIAAWNAAGFRRTSTAYVDGAGERLCVVLTEQNDAAVSTDVRGVWSRRQACRGTRVTRTITVRKTWRTDVLHRGLSTWRDAGRPTFVVDVRPDPHPDGSGADVVLVVFVRQAAGFQLESDARRLRRAPDGSWVPAEPRRRAVTGGA